MGLLVGELGFPSSVASNELSRPAATRSAMAVAGGSLPFDLKRWKATLLASADQDIDTVELLEAEGLIEEDYLLEDITLTMAMIQAQHDDDGRPRGPKNRGSFV